MSMHEVLSQLDSLATAAVQGTTTEREMLDAAVAERIVAPPSWNIDAGIEGPLDRRYLKFEATSSTPSPSLISEFMNAVRACGFPRGAEFEVMVLWPTVEAFSAETALGSVNRVSVESSFTTMDPMKGRIAEHACVLHALRADMKWRTLTVTAVGDHADVLSQILPKLAPQRVGLRLSERDAGRVIQKCCEHVQPRVRQMLKPSQVSIGSMLNFLIPLRKFGENGERESVIEFEIPLRDLRSWENDIGKKLVNGVYGEESFVTHGSHWFWFKRDILPALQMIANAGQAYEPKHLFGAPLLAFSDAERLFNKEIEHIHGAWKEFYYFGQNSWNTRRQMTLRLAREHLGEDLLLPFDELGPSEYLAFLRSKGFQRDGEDVVDVDMMILEYVVATIPVPPHAKKERYLFEFCLQAYARNPERYVEAFRRSFVNPPPETRVTGRISTAARRAHRIRLPEKAIITGCRVEIPHRGEGYFPSPSIRVDHSPSGKSSIFMNAPLCGSALMSFQEQIYRSIGGSFRA